MKVLGVQLALRRPEPRRWFSGDKPAAVRTDAANAGGARLASPNRTTEHERLVRLAVAAVGVVYGDIGTSPLYALRECFHGAHGVAASRANVLGVLCLVFWSLLLLVGFKYLTLLLRVSNNGQGGILALLATACPVGACQKKRQKILLALGVFGAALLYGDGMITPAISVLSAVEGLKMAAPALETFVLPLTIGAVVGLFSLQRWGSGGVGKVFGPLMLVWFATIAMLGLVQVIRAPGIFQAIHPGWGWQFFASNGFAGFVVLGAVFLVVTGSESLYADMGHFGKTPIRLAGLWIVVPALLLNYFGQGALLLQTPSAASHPFYNLCPKALLIPIVILATLATVVASQALISGAFSLTLQAIQLGYSPRMRVDHTSSAERGQIYIPEINWVLMVACICLVLGFQSSSHLAAAYGVAVSLTMVITTIFLYRAAARSWKWHPVALALVCAGFLAIELAFLGSNLMKVMHGGWFPLLVAAVIFTLMTTWHTGRHLLGQRLRQSSFPLETFIEDVLKPSGPVRVRGTAVFLSGRPGGTPLALLHNLKHNKVLHERVVILTVMPEERPHVPLEERISLLDLGHGFYRVTGRLGFMDEPNVPKLLLACGRHGLELRPQEITYFLSRETILPSHREGMAIWREKLFAVLSRNAQNAAAFFRLPANRVVELGMHVEI